MKASARNHFEGVVQAVREGSINDEVDLETAQGLRVVATVTRESRQALGLEAGRQAFALIKASSIVLVSGVGSARFSARNQYAGTVQALVRGAVNSEVSLLVAGGMVLTAIITNESAVGMDLQVGGAATALFKASSVIVGVHD